MNLTVSVNWALAITLFALLGAFATEARNLVRAATGILGDLLKGCDQLLGNLPAALWVAVKPRATVDPVHPLLGLVLFAGAGMTHQGVPSGQIEMIGEQHQGAMPEAAPVISDTLSCSLMCVPPLAVPSAFPSGRWKHGLPYLPCRAQTGLRNSGEIG